MGKVHKFEGADGKVLLVNVSAIAALEYYEFPEDSFTEPMDSYVHYRIHLIAGGEISFQFSDDDVRRLLKGIEEG